MAAAEQDVPEAESPESGGEDLEGVHGEEEDWRPRQPLTRRLRASEAGVEVGAEASCPQDFSNEGLRLGYRILQDLMRTNSTFLHYPEATKGMVDYHDVIKKPMWFEEIKRKYDSYAYSSVTEFVSDVRLLLSNTYCYFGPNTVQTKRALRIEQVFENKLLLLPEELRSQCSLENLSEIKFEKVENDHHSLQKGDEFHSVLLERLSGKRMEREKNRRAALEEERKAASSGAGKAAKTWETDILLAPPAITQMRTMWELPLIGHFIQLTTQVLHIDEVPQFELERVFLMPQASKTLARLMTSLLSPPLQRPKLQLHPPMPYSIWSRKLFLRVASWYKLYNARSHDHAKVFELSGIEKEFWKILGDWNQLEDYEFHELSFHQRVWLIKTLCDNLVHHHKTMQDALADHSQSQQDCVLLGEDRHKRQYLHFPQFYSIGGLSTCIRVYRRIIPVETLKFEEHADNSPKLIHTGRGRGNFFPSWMQRGRGKGKRGRSLVSKRSKMGKEINRRNFLSRLVYRMPNGMYIKQRKKRGYTRGLSLNSSMEQQAEKSSDPSLVPLGSIEDLESGNDNKVSCEETEESNRRLTRQSRNTSTGMYAEWSESDSQGTLSPGATPCKKTNRKKRSFAAVSVEDEHSNNGSIKLKLVSTSSSGVGNNQDETEESESDDSEGDEAEKSHDSNHDSGCDDEVSRSSGWTSRDQKVKAEDLSREFEDADEDGKDEINHSLKNRTDFIDNLGEDSPLILTQKDSGKKKRPHYDPHWLLLGAEHFELVAESIQGVRDLIDSLCESEEDLSLFQRSCMTGEDAKPVCEQKLEKQLQKLIEEVMPFELKIEKNTHQLRCKLHDEWKEFKERPTNYVDKSEDFWLTLLSQYSTSGDSMKKASQHSLKVLAEACIMNRTGSIEMKSENADEDSQTGGEIRHSLRVKRQKIDTLTPWLQSDSDLSESDEEDELDDSWEMPNKRQKRKQATVENAEKKISKSKKVAKKVPEATDKIMFEPDLKPVSSELSSENSLSKPGNELKQKRRQKMLPNKLTLDKEGNMFITLSCGTKVQLRTDAEGRIIVPEGHEGLSMISGKTLEQLVGTGKVVQNKKAKRKTAKRSTTLFPATPISATESQIWAADMGETSLSLPCLTKDIFHSSATRGTSVSSNASSAKETSISNTSSASNNLEMSSHQKKMAYLIKETHSVPSCSTKTSEPEEIVIVSDESDDSIEVIKEAKPKKTPPQNGVPRIQSVVGNANLNSFAPKPLTKSVTLTPVIISSKSKSATVNNDSTQWNPVISNACSLEQITKSPVPGRVKPPGAPDVIITPTNGTSARRNLHQTNAYQHPSFNGTNYVSISSIPARQSQSQFVPVTQVVPNFIVGSTSFSPVNLNNQYLQSLPLVTGPPPTPQALPVNGYEIGLPPGLMGQIVLANCDNNQYSYAFKLDDGGLIFLSNQQISKIRAANGGRLTTMVTFCTQ